MQSYGSGSLTASGNNLVVEEDTGRHLIATRYPQEDDHDDWNDEDGDWDVASGRPVNIKVVGEGSGSLTFRC